MSGREVSPVFSPDGNQVAFTYRGEPKTSGIYVALVDGEKPLRLTDNERDFNPTWSPDGRQIAFVRSSKEGVSIYVMVPVAGGDEVHVSDRPAGDKWYNWALTLGGIYFLKEDLPREEIEFLKFATGKTVPILALEKSSEYYGGLAVSPDGRSLLYNQLDLADSYIVLIKNFR